MSFEEYGSQVREWIDGVMKSRAIDPRQTLELCDTIRQYGEKTDDEKLLGFAYYYSGETYYLLNDVDQLFRNVSRSMTYLENSKQNELLARAYNILAITSMNRGNAPFAMDYYLRALDFCEKYQLREVAVIVNINIGTLYNHFEENKQAQHYFDVAYQILRSIDNVGGLASYLLNIYIGLGNSFMARELLPRAEEFELRAQRECMGRISEVEQLCFTCFQARLYHSMGKLNLRDECIAKVQDSVHKKIVVLDIFDDFYDYCEMLFAAGRYMEMNEVVDWLDEMAKKTRIIYMQRRLLSLRIRYYKMRNEADDYLRATSQYFELSEISEKENRYMVSSILNMRYRLEETTQSRREMEAENRILLERSQTDALTGIANRYHLNEYAEDAFQRAMNRQSHLSIEILDIDYFKQYNDNYGHQEGDECIKTIAATLQQMEERGNIFCARYGGDEFIIIYEGYAKDSVIAMAEELRENIMALHIEHRYSLAQQVVTISQGICHDIPQPDNKVWDFLHAADMMLYRVKERCRNSVCIGRCGEHLDN